VAQRSRGYTVGSSVLKEEVPTRHHRGAGFFSSQRDLIDRRSLWCREERLARAKLDARLGRDAALALRSARTRSDRAGCSDISGPCYRVRMPTMLTRRPDTPGGQRVVTVLA